MSAIFKIIVNHRYARIYFVERIWQSCLAISQLFHQRINTMLLHETIRLQTAIIYAMSA